MSAATEKVHSLEDYKKETKAEEYEAVTAELNAKSRSDMGMVAMFIAILAVLMVVFFFFSLNQNITGLTGKVEALNGVKEEVAALNTSFGGMETRVTELEKLPAKTKNMIIVNDIADMSQKLTYLGTQLGDEQQAEKLLQAKELLNELQLQLAQ